MTLQIPMRDGTELPTDIYLPEENAKNLPCILIRSPAGLKAATALSPTHLTKDGYVIAVQATRSALDLEGKTIPYRTDGWHEQQDGYDTVEWLAKHPYTNGKIGTLGSSALGITQLLMAPANPPSLKCQYIGVAAPSLYHYAIFPNGKLLKHQVESWLGYYAKDPGVCHYVVNQPMYNEFWEEFDSLKVVNRVNTPAIHQGGWYDIFIQGTIDAFVARQEHGGPGANGHQKLLIGPWMHFWPQVTKLGDFSVPEHALKSPIDLSPLSWFNHYLKGDANGIEKQPAVTYYVMGPFDGSPSSGNVWRTADSWPIPSEETPFYLTANGGLVAKNEAVETTATYTHDPAKPVPTMGGLNLFLASGPVDQRPIETRDDVLVFTSEPLSEDLEITGRLKAICYITSDVPDTDIAVRLCDVYPDGKSILIADGIYRTGLTEHDQNVPLKAVIDLWSTSLVFAKGHKIRVSLSGSNFPRYELNYHRELGCTDTSTQHIARNHIHFGGNTPTHLVLPVIKKGENNESHHSSGGNGKQAWGLQHPQTTHISH
jgi:hypothetical protein